MERSEMDHVLQKTLPVAPWMNPAMARLPGVQPLEWRDWLEVDDAYAGQMALRDRLLAERQGDVLQTRPGSEVAQTELLRDVCEWMYGQDAFAFGEDEMRRPDGVVVPYDPKNPLLTLARMVQEDFCILQERDGEHVLTAAVLCFPASWTLSEKMGRPLTAIHGPVDSYTPQIAARVQRLFDAVHPDRPLWRQNALLYADPGLYQPRREADPRDDSDRERRYLRSEKQCLLRLPESRAVVFSIHTYVVPVANLTPDQRAGLKALEAAE